MALYIPQSILHLARSLYVRPETYGPTYVCVCGALMVLNILKTERNLLYMLNQSVPRCKHYPPQL